MGVRGGKLQFALFVVVAWATFQGALLLINPTSPIHGRLTDPDGYMRIVRVEELAHSHDWYDSSISRSNAPYGEELHWTRPFDIVVLATAAPLQPFIGTDSAIFWGGAFVCPLLMLALLFVVVWAAQPLVPEGKWLIVPLLLVQPLLIADSVAGRFDHHMLQLLLFAVLIGAATRLLLQYDRKMAWLAGAAAALGMWVSVEMLLPFIAIAGVFAVRWMLDGRRESARILWQVTASQAGLLAVALVIERPPRHLFDLEYDKISIPYLFGSVLLAISAAALCFAPSRIASSSPRTRFLIGTALAAACLGLLTLVFPGALKGPEAGIDPAIRPIWLDHVAEMQSVFGSWPSVSGAFLQYVAQGTLAACALVLTLKATRHKPEFAAWLAVAVILAIYLVSTYLHVRSGGFLAIVASVVIARLLLDTRSWLERHSLPLIRSLTWSAAAVSCIAGFMVGGRAMDARAETATVEADTNGCMFDKISGFLNERYDSHEELEVMAANIDFGPEILYRTPFSILAGPYHRNSSGILDLHNLFVSDESISHQIVDKRGVSLLLVCPTPGEQFFLGHPESPDSLYSSLVSGENVPTWLQEVTIPAQLKSSFKLFEVVRQ